MRQLIENLMGLLLLGLVLSVGFMAGVIGVLGPGPSAHGAATAGAAVLVIAPPWAGARRDSGAARVGSGANLADRQTAEARRGGAAPASAGGAQALIGAAGGRVIGPVSAPFGAVGSFPGPVPSARLKALGAWAVRDVTAVAALCGLRT